MLFLFFVLCEWGGWVLKSAENSALFFKPSFIQRFFSLLGGEGGGQSKLGHFPYQYSFIGWLP